jgi:hypothetical protein
MNQPLHAHIVFLEETVQELRSALTLGSLSRTDRERIQLQIEFATHAIHSYRQGYEMEYFLRAGRPKSNHDSV